MGKNQKIESLRLKKLYDIKSLSSLKSDASFDFLKLEKKCSLNEESLYRVPLLEVLELLNKLPSLKEVKKRGELNIDTSSSVIKIGNSNLFSKEENENFKLLIKALKPWRKGPFNLFGNFIDAEWRSDKKWDRIKEEVKDVKGKKVCDVGCGNGYYMLRIREFEPECVVGLDPSQHFWFTFYLLNYYLEDKRLQYQLLGVQDLVFYDEFFDLVLCMGVIYHQRNPLSMLKKIYDSLLPGGKMLLESMVIPGDSSSALCPFDRYARMRNVYFIPTLNCLKTWAKKSGFIDIKVCSVSELNETEQRVTKYGPKESLREHLDKENKKLTHEGYPAPMRASIVGYKRKVKKKKIKKERVKNNGIKK